MILLRADIIHIKGDQNIVTDCLSRLALVDKKDVYDLPEIVKTQLKDIEIKSYS